MNRTSKIALSIDLDDWYHTPMITGSSFSIYKTVDDFFKDWKKEYDFITESTLKVIELLDRYNIKATFFVIADEVERYPKMIKALKNTKHEIACHSLHHYVPIDTRTKKETQSKDEWKNELVLSKKILENTFEREVIGYRAPGAYFAPWMLPILEETGFKYDSSIAYNFLYNKTSINLFDIPTYPYRLNKMDLSDRNPDSELLELPFSNFKIMGKILPAGGAFFFRLLGLNYFKIALKQNLKYGDSMFYFHSLDVTDTGIPLNNFKKRPFYWINKGKNTLNKIESLIQYFSNELTDCITVYKKYILDCRENDK